MSNNIIYKISGPNNISGQSKDYIGQTSIGLKKRWINYKSEYKSQLKKNKYLYQMFEKYNIDNFTIETIEDCGNSSLDEAEIYWIKELNTIKPNGYNLQAGGIVTIHHQETKELISQIQKQGSLSEDLPMYMSKYTANGRHGYRIQYTPLNKRASFMVPIAESCDDVLLKAKRYLQSYIDMYNRSISGDPDSLPLPEVLPEIGHKVGASVGLPMYINNFVLKQNGKITRHGFKVKYGPDNKTRNITCTPDKDVSDDMLAEAIRIRDGLITDHNKKILEKLEKLKL